MNTTEYSLKIDQEGKLINITGISSGAVLIDYSGDIDFTKLVSELTQSIDTKALLRPNDDNDTSEDNTLMLILDTIESIVEEYNNSVRSLFNTDDEGEETEENIEGEFDDDPLF